MHGTKRVANSGYGDIPENDVTALVEGTGAKDTCNVPGNKGKPGQWRLFMRHFDTPTEDAFDSKNGTGSSLEGSGHLIQGYASAQRVGRGPLSCTPAGVSNSE
jgi:hypothetical protein